MGNARYLRALGRFTVSALVGGEALYGLLRLDLNPVLLVVAFVATVYAWSKMNDAYLLGLIVEVNLSDIKKLEARLLSQEKWLHEAALGAAIQQSEHMRSRKEFRS